MTPRRASWKDHNGSIHRREVGKADRVSGSGLWVDTVVDHEGMPSAVVVCPNGKVLTVRLHEIKDEAGIE